MVLPERVAGAEEPVVEVERSPPSPPACPAPAASSSARSDARTCSPSGMPSCSPCTDAYGPATSVVKYVESGWVGVRCASDRARTSTRRGAVAQHRPVRRCRHVEDVAGLEVGLVEAGEPARRRLEEAHGVEVGEPVGGVDVAVQPLPVAGVGHPALDLEDVGGLQAPSAGSGPRCQDARSSGLPVEGRPTRAQSPAKSTNVESRRAREPQHGARPEGRSRPASRQVEGDLDGVDAAGRPRGSRPRSRVRLVRPSAPVLMRWPAVREARSGPWVKNCS